MWIWNAWSCWIRPGPIGIWTVSWDIIMEETEYRFSGNRDVQTVAAQTQNRVQMYPDEGK